MRLATFVIDGLKSKVRGFLQVFRDTQDINSDKPVFEVNPGTAAGSESTTVRGAFEVKGSSGGSSDNETVLFKVNKTSADGSSGETYVKDFLQVGDATGAVQIGGGSQLVGIGKADSLGLNGRQNPNTTSDFYLMRSAPWTKVMARGDSLGRDDAGVTAANIFANPPLDKMGAFSHHHFEDNPFPTANKSPIQNGGAESWEVLTLNLNDKRAVQIAAQNYDVSGQQNRAFIRSRHVDNSDYSQWQAWREFAKMGDNASFWNITANLIEASVLEFAKVPSNAGHGGAIDFHWNGSSADYTSRIIEDAQGRISVYANLNVSGAVAAASLNVSGAITASGGAALSGPLLPMTNPISGSASISPGGVYTPPRGWYTFGKDNTYLGEYASGPYSGSARLMYYAPDSSLNMTIYYRRY